MKGNASFQSQAGHKQNTEESTGERKERLYWIILFVQTSKEGTRLSKAVAPFYIPATVHEGSDFSTSSPTRVAFWACFANSDPDPV